MAVRVREKDKGSGEWWVFVAHRGQRKAKKVGDKRTADKVAAEIRRQLALGDFKLAPVGPTFEVLAEEWLAKYPLVHSIRPSTAENYLSFTRRHLIPFFGRTPVTDITSEAVENFIAAKRSAGGSTRFPDRGLNARSLRTALIPLRLILQRAVKMGLLSANPAKALGRLSSTPLEGTVDPFSPAELREIFEAAHVIDPALATMYRLWVQSGMRSGEVYGLQWQDIDLERGTVIVRRTHSRDRTGPTKTGKVRTVSILHPVADDTTEWRPGSTVPARSVLSGLRRLTASIDPAAFVFGNGGSPPSRQHFDRLWHRAVRKAGVRYRVAEQFRHTFASLMLSRNAPLLYVQRMGGWSTAGVLLQVYATWVPSDFEGVLTTPAASPAHPDATRLQPRAGAAVAQA